MRFRTLGAVAGLAVVMVACGGTETGDESSEAALTHQGDQSDKNDHNECQEKAKKECVTIDADKNITQVFLELVCDDASDFKVTVETDQFGEVDVTDKLKDKGGPCKDIDRDFWFVVPGPDKEAKVCVEFEGDKKAEVKVSYKAASVCEEVKSLFNGEQCKNCEQKHHCRDHGDKDSWQNWQHDEHDCPGSLGGSGGSGGYGGSSGPQ